MFLMGAIKIIRFTLASKLFMIQQIPKSQSLSNPLKNKDGRRPGRRQESAEEGHFIDANEAFSVERRNHAKEGNTIQGVLAG